MVGWPVDPANPDARAALPKVRELLSGGDYTGAVSLITASVMAKPLRQMPYQPLGDLRLMFAGGEAPTEYRRELNLDTAIARVSYVAGGVRFVREVLSSPVDQVIVLQVDRGSAGRTHPERGPDEPSKLKADSPAKREQEACEREAELEAWSRKLEAGSLEPGSFKE